MARIIGSDIAPDPAQERRPTTTIPAANAERPGGDQKAGAIPDRDIRAARRLANARVIRDAIASVRPEGWRISA